VSKIVEPKTVPSPLSERCLADRDHTLAEDWTPQQILLWAYETYGQDVAVASAFGAEGIALIDLAASIRPQLRIFILDTSFLFPETYKLIEQIEERYQIEVERVLPSLTPSEQAQIHGQDLWKTDPDLCCRIRKVEPLSEKLAQLRAWVTAIRREQTPARADAKKIEWDPRTHVMKINPILDWTNEMVWSYIRERQLPYNPLHDLNYPSIGCTHCTRAILPGEDSRAGRWPGFAKRECGIHACSSSPDKQYPQK